MSTRSADINEILEAFDDLTVSAEKKAKEASDVLAKRAAAQIAPLVIEAIRLQVLSSKIPHEEQYEYENGYCDYAVEELNQPIYSIMRYCSALVTLPLRKVSHQDELELEAHVSKIFHDVISPIIYEKFSDKPNVLDEVLKAFDHLLRYALIVTDCRYNIKQGYPSPNKYKVNCETALMRIKHRLG